MNAFSNTVMTATLAVLTLSGCEPPNPQAPENLTMTPMQERGATGREKFADISSAKAELAPTADAEVSGTVVFTPSKGKNAMDIEISISGLSPGAHGFHIHAKPDCGDEGKAAGGHFNPTENPHGGPDAEQQHAGDLGNVEANEKGSVETRLTSDQLAFSGSNNILNRAVVVHADRDDLQSQPSGAAGDRVACGIIRQQRDTLASSD